MFLCPPQENIERCMAHVRVESTIYNHHSSRWQEKKKIKIKFLRFWLRALIQFELDQVVALNLCVAERTTAT